MLKAYLIIVMCSVALLLSACNRDVDDGDGKSATLLSPEAFAASQAALTQTPPMGFNSWLAYDCNVTEGIIRQTADNFVALGLKDVGYQYINIDECWESNQRDAAGNLQVDSVKFPSGIAALAKYVHERGLKLGIYQAVGKLTCRDRPAMEGHYEQDMQLFADWGVDYIKLDLCDQTTVDAIRKNCDNISMSQEIKASYEKAYEAVRKTGKNMVLSLSGPAYLSLCGEASVPYHDSLLWTARIANLWRAEIDTDGSWGSLLKIYEQNIKLGLFQKKGHWNDPDMLAIGGKKLSYVQQQSQFILWSEMAAPLLLSFDISKDATAQAIAKNREVIAVSQDAAGQQGVRIVSNAAWDVLAKPLADGGAAIVFFNKTDTPQDAMATPKGLGLSHAVYAKDLVSSKSQEIKSMDIYFKVKLAPYEARIFRISPLKK